MKNILPVLAAFILFISFSSLVKNKVYAFDFSGKMKMKDISKEEQQKVPATVIELSYSNQHNFGLQTYSGAFDCEAMVAFNQF